MKTKLFLLTIFTISSSNSCMKQLEFTYNDENITVSGTDQQINRMESIIESLSEIINDLEPDVEISNFRQDGIEGGSIYTIKNFKEISRIDIITIYWDTHFNRLAIGRYPRTKKEIIAQGLNLNQTPYYGDVIRKEDFKGETGKHIKKMTLDFAHYIKLTHLMESLENKDKRQHKLNMLTNKNYNDIRFITQK